MKSFHLLHLKSLCTHTILVKQFLIIVAPMSRVHQNLTVIRALKTIELHPYPTTEDNKILFKSYSQVYTTRKYGQFLIIVTQMSREHQNVTVIGVLKTISLHQYPTLEDNKIFFKSYSQYKPTLHKNIEYGHVYSHFIFYII